MAGLSLGIITTNKVNAQTPPSCNFTKDLEVGSVGEDVLCLQKFLNSNGFTITDTGAGSPGNETDLFGTLTNDAGTKWQTAQGLSPASGYFGPKSRGAYKAGGTSAATPATPATPASPSGQATPGMPSIQEVVAKLSDYADLIKKLQDENAELKNNQNESGGNDDVREMLKDAHNMVEDAEDAIDDAEDAFDDEDFDDAIELAEEAQDLADQAVDAIGS